MFRGSFAPTPQVLVCPEHISAVIETMGAKVAAAVTLTLNNVPSNLQATTVHVWHTCENTSFVQQPDLAVSGSGSLDVTLPPQCIITLVRHLQESSIFVQHCSMRPPSNFFQFSMREKHVH